MTEEGAKILAQALALPEDDQVVIANELIAHFQLSPDPEVDALWAKEAEDRLDAYERGELKAVPGDEVFARINKRRKSR